MKKITTTQYASARGISTAAVRKAIINGHNLPGVKCVERFGNQHSLIVDTRELADHLNISEKKLLKDLEVTFA